MGMVESKRQRRHQSNRRCCCKKSRSQPEKSFQIGQNSLKNHESIRCFVCSFSKWNATKFPWSIVHASSHNNVNFKGNVLNHPFPMERSRSECQIENEPISLLRNSLQEFPEEMIDDLKTSYDYQRQMKRVDEENRRILENLCPEKMYISTSDLRICDNQRFPPPLKCQMIQGFFRPVPPPQNLLKKSSTNASYLWTLFRWNIFSFAWKKSFPVKKDIRIRVKSSFIYSIKFLLNGISSYAKHMPTFSFSQIVGSASLVKFNGICVPIENVEIQSSTIRVQSDLNSLFRQNAEKIVFDSFYLISCVEQAFANASSSIILLNIQIF